MNTLGQSFRNCVVHTLSLIQRRLMMHYLESAIHFGSVVSNERCLLLYISDALSVMLLLAGDHESLSCLYVCIEKPEMSACVGVYGWESWSLCLVRWGCLIEGHLRQCALKRSKEDSWETPLTIRRIRRKASKRKSFVRSADMIQAAQFQNWKLPLIIISFISFVHLAFLCLSVLLGITVSMSRFACRLTSSSMNPRIPRSVCVCIHLILRWTIHSCLYEGLYRSSLSIHPSIHLAVKPLWRYPF